MTQSLKKPDQEDYYNIADLLDENCMNYAKYVLTSRAIPDLRDGCKPIHRRIVWSFYKNKIVHDKPRSKSANAVGGVLAYSPHGDSSVYDACVRLANDSVNINIIDGKGSFSSVTARDVMAGAARYTEIRLSEFTTEILDGIDKNVVDMMLNYDESKYEPTVLPAKLPLILCNPNQGIGVGLSSNICGFNMCDVVDYTVDTINNKKTKLICPDFPTGGEYIYNKNTLKNIHDNGRGSLKLRAKYTTTKDSIIITEIPYTTTREAICEKVIELVKQGKIKEVSDINDYTGVKGLNITVDLKRNSDPELVMQKLFKTTPLESSFSCNFTVLSNGKPKVLGVKQIINDWIVFRKECVRRELEFNIQNIEKELNKLNGLSIILSDLDKAISIIRSSKSEREVMKKLTTHFKLNQHQVEYICTIRLVNMNEEWINNRVSKLKDMESTISQMKSDISSDKYYNQTIISQLKDIKAKYSQPRRTEIIYESEIVEITQEDMIEDYNCQIVLTKEGYLKKTNVYSINQRLKDGDILSQQIQSTNKSKLLLFTNKANCYYLNVYELDTTLPSNLGDYLPTLLQLQDEQILYAISTEDYKGCMLFAFENGKVAKVNLSSYETKTNRTRVVNAYNTNSKLLSIHYIENDCDFIAISSIDKVLVFDTSLINAKDSKASQGVNVLRSKDDSKMVLFKPCEIEDEDIKAYYKVNIPAVGKYSRKDF